MSNGNDSAFPHHHVNNFGDTLNAEAGLTKREFCAMMAMQGLLSAIYSSKEMLNEFTTSSSRGYEKYHTACDAISVNATAFADALLAELAKKETP